MCYIFEAQNCMQYSRCGPVSTQQKEIISNAISPYSSLWQGTLLACSVCSSRGQEKHSIRCKTFWSLLWPCHLQPVFYHLALCVRFLSGLASGVSSSLLQIPICLFFFFFCIHLFLLFLWSSYFLHLNLLRFACVRVYNRDNTEAMIIKLRWCFMCCSW